MPVGAEFMIINKTGEVRSWTRGSWICPKAISCLRGGVLMNISYFASDRGRGDAAQQRRGPDRAGPVRLQRVPRIHGTDLDRRVAVPVQDGQLLRLADAAHAVLRAQLPVPPPYTTGDEKLKYDGQATDNMGTPLTFVVDVEAGKTYEVMIFTGDTGWNHDREKFTVTGSGGTTLSQQVDTWGAGVARQQRRQCDLGRRCANTGRGLLPLGPPDHHRRRLAGHDRQASPMTMQDLGGWDGAAVILAMDIRPVATVGQITLTPLAALPADGVSVGHLHGQRGSAQHRADGDRVRAQHAHAARRQFALLEDRRRLPGSPRPLRTWT